MNNFGNFLCIIQSILFFLTMMSLAVDGGEKFSIIFLPCWLISFLLLFYYCIFYAGGAK